MLYRNDNPPASRAAVALLAVLAAAGGVARARAGGEAPPDVSLVAPLRLAPVSVLPRPRAEPKHAVPVLASGPLEDAGAAVKRELARGAFPGATLAAGRRAEVALLRGYGTTGWGDEPADPEETIYDVASLTKVVATTTAVMLLVEDGRMELDAPVRRYLPDFGGGARGRVTVRHLLAHTSGLPAGASAAGGTPAKALGRLVKTPLKRAPGKRMEYSDVGFVVLWAAAQRAAGEPLPELLERRVYDPLGMASTGFLPGGAECARCSPTWRRADGTAVRGQVHDPIARRLGGVAGNAGLFSTARDLGRFAAMLASGGALDSVRVLREETLAAFTRLQPNAGNRALGWEKPRRDGYGAGGRRVSSAAFGHTGFTGTSLWVDPERGTWTVLLSNRTLERGAPNRMQALRRAVNDDVALAADLAE